MMKTNKVLILKDNYNSFEKYYLEKLNCLNENIQAKHYYKSDNLIRKLFTHYGLPCEAIWYGKWKKQIGYFDIIIVFDSIHTSNIIKYIRSRTDSRLIFWHWNPIISKKDVRIYFETKELCEHWTFNHKDAKDYGMRYNNQFFFWQCYKDQQNHDSVIFVGKDKGRYQKILEVAQKLRAQGFNPDFHIIVSNIAKYECKDFLQEQYVDYSEILESIRKSKAVLEIVQEGQTGITARALESMFMHVKLITNNKNIKKYDFYRSENIFILDCDDLNCLGEFLGTPFVEVESDIIEQYSAEGWIFKFEKQES